MSIARVSCAWQGWPGSPGVTQLYLAAGPTQAQIDNFRTFFNALAGLLPSGLTIQVPSSGDVINEVDGSITGSWSVGVTPAVVTGSNLAVYAGNAGAVVHWLTGQVVRRRRVRGRTFLVPLASTSFQTDGSISAAALTTISNAASALVAGNANSFLVWSRPKPGLSGIGAAITSSRVPDLAISLRSRRI